MVYVPAGVPAGTLTTPEAGSIIGTGPPLMEVAGVVTVPVTRDGSTTTPLITSLS